MLGTVVVTGAVETTGAVVVTAVGPVLLVVTGTAGNVCAGAVLGLVLQSVEFLQCDNQ